MYAAHISDMIMIERIIDTLRSQYSLDDYKASRALIMAPFEQKYVDQAIQRLSASRAVKALAKQEDYLVIIITSTDYDVSACPDMFKVIQIRPISGWPTHDRYHNRFVKWAIPLLFKNIKTSIYLDTKLFITHSQRKITMAFNAVERYSFMCTNHPVRTGWGDEWNEIMKYSICINKEMLRRQKRRFETIGIPTRTPVYQNNILGRVHISEFNALNLEVLSQIFHYSERDQLGLIYAIHKTGKKITGLAEGELLLTYWGKHINFKTLCFIQDKPFYRRLVVHCLTRRIMPYIQDKRAN